MTRLRWMILSGVLAGLLAQPAAAQDTPFSQPDDLISALVVKARTPGPAWWKVSDADTTVWILGSPGLLPKNVEWDDATLKRRLTGANRLILPPREGASIMGAIGLVASLKKTLFDSRPVADRLPPALFERLKGRWSEQERRGLRVEASIGIPEGVDFSTRQGAPPENPSSDPFTDRNPLQTVILAVMVLRYADAPLGKLVNEPATRADALAASLKTPRLRAGTYDELAALKAAAALPEAAQQACLAGSLDMLDAQDAKVAQQRARARAWAQGDVPAALGRSDRLDMAGVCPTPAAVRTMAARNVTAAVSAVRAELRKPGHAVAVVDLADLLQVGGVLDQLRGVRGVTITAPDRIED